MKYTQYNHGSRGDLTVTEVLETDGKISTNETEVDIRPRQWKSFNDEENRNEIKMDLILLTDIPHG